MAITPYDLPESIDDKLLAHGTKHLSDTELLAILLRSSGKRENTVTVAQALLATFSSIRSLCQASAHDVCQQIGMGKALWMRLQVAVEIGKRYQAYPSTARNMLNTSQQTKQFIRYKLADYPHEVFACLFLTVRLRLIAYEELNHGTLTEATVYPREVIKKCLTHNAAKIIVAHNHPSGDATPSHADKALTKQLQDALALIDVQLIDHIIIGHNIATSLAELGLLNNKP